MPIAPTPRPVLEEFEPRILYAADLAAVVQGLGDAATAGAWQSLTTTQPTAVAAQEIAFVDLSLPDAQTLVAGLQAQKDAGRAIDIVTIDAGEDGLSVIAQALEGRSDISAIHLLGHGSDGLVRLGAVALDGDLLLARAGEIAEWSRVLTAEADLLIYGCDVAASEAGRELVQALAALSGADVAASDDATGSALLGGDWLLEHATGSIDTASVADASLQAAYQGLLGSEFQVNVTTQNIQLTAALNRGSLNAVAADGSGNIVVAWSGNGQDGSGGAIIARRFTADGTPLTGEIAVNAVTASNQSQASVVSDAAGNFVVVWTSVNQDGSGDAVVLRRFAADGTPLTGDIVVNSTSTLNQNNPTIAMNRATGAFIVAWQGQGTNDGQGIWFRRFNADATPLDGAERSGNLVDNGAEQNPAVAMDTSGRFVIAWDVDNRVWFQRFDATGTAVGSRTSADPTNLGSNTMPAVAMDDAGGFVVAYREANIAPGIWARGFNADGSGRISSFQVATGDATQAALAMASDGSFAVTYQRTGTDLTEVYLRRYSASGTALITATQLNASSAGTQQSASLAWVGGTQYVAAWSGASAIDGAGVQARSMGDAAPVITSLGGGASAVVSVTEGSFQVATLTATDADAGSSLSYSIIGGVDAARFAVDAVTGALRFLSAPDFEVPGDAGANNVYDVLVAVSDGTSSDTQAIAVQVTDVGSTIVVTTVADTSDGDTSSIDALVSNPGADGAISLREAIDAANKTSGADTIHFAIPGSGVRTIVLQNDLDRIRDTLTIDGSTQTGYAGTPLIQIDGTNTSNEGLVFEGGSEGSVVRGLIIGAFKKDGIAILADNITVQGNFIGTNASGTAARGNDGGGIYIESAGNLIGGTTAAQRNVISGNGVGDTPGIEIRGAAALDNVIQGNYIGLNAAGTAAIGNASEGIVIYGGASRTQIGGTATGAGNVISGHSSATASAIWINAGSGHVIQGNKIGTNAAGTAALPNGYAGILIDSSSGNLVGGTVAGAGNTIANASVAHGVGVEGTGAQGNSVLGNAFYGNPEKGIDIAGNWLPAVNDGLKSATAANAGMDSPVFLDAQVTGTQLGVRGYVGSAAGQSLFAGARVEIFIAEPDASGFGEGRTYLGFLTTDANGGFTGVLTVSGVTSASRLTATATDGAGNTSEFGANRAVTSWVNSTPVITSNGGAATASVNQSENVEWVTTVTATDSDVFPQALTYSIVGGADAARFVIDSSTGVLQFVTVPDHDSPADSDLNNLYAVTVQVSDGIDSDSQALSIQVLPVNDNPPVITSGGGGSTASYTVSENTTAVTTVMATDADLPAQALSFSIVGGADAARFTIEATSGLLRFAASPDFEAPVDADGNNVYELVVQVGDGSTTDAQAITVNVLDSSTGDVLLAAQDTYITKSSALNHGQSTSLVLDKSGDAIGDGRVLLQFDLSAIPLGATITGAQLQMTATQNAGALNLNVYRLTSAWTEGTGDASAGAANWDQRIAGTNWVTAGGDYDPVAVASLNSGSIGLHQWDLTALVTDWVQANVANDGIMLGSPDGGGTTVTYDSAEGTNAPKLVVSFTLDNTPPAITSGGGGGTAAVSITENSLEVATITASDSDLPVQALNFSIVGGADAARFTIDATSGLLRFTAAPDFEAPADAGADNVYAVVVQVSDGAGGVDQQSLAVTVTGLNDASPVIMSNGGAATASIAVSENSTVVTTVMATDVDQPAQALSFSIVGGADAARFTIDATSGLLRFTAAPDFEAPADADSDNVYDLVVQVSDGVWTDAQSIVVQVTNVLESSVARDDSTGTLAAQPVTVDVLANDSVDASRTLQLLDVQAPARGSANLVGGQVVYTPDAGWTGSDDFRYRVTDGSEGLALYWRLDGDAQAAVGTANGSLVNGPATIDGAWGRALDFDGVNDHVLLPDLSYTNSFTLSFWFRLDDNAGSGFRYLYSHGETAFPNTLNVFVIEDDAATASGIQAVIRTRLIDNDDLDDLSGLDVPVAGLADGQWHQYTLSVEAGTGSRVYIDGTARAASANGGQALNPTGNVVLGANTTLSSLRFLDGGLDGLALYGRALSGTEVAALPSGASSAMLTVITSGSAPLAAADNYTLDEDGVLAAAPGVLANDVAGGSGPLAAELLSGPANAVSFTLRADGSFDYVPMPDFNGSDSFIYRARGDGLVSAATTVSLTVLPINDAPVITHAGGVDSVDLVRVENTLTVTTLSATDIDTPVSALRWSVAGGADAARFVVDALSGVLSFAAAPDAEAPSDADADGTYVVTLQVDDGSMQDLQTLRVTISDGDEFDVGLPMDIDPAADRVLETAVPGTTVGLQVRAVDADASQNGVSYALTDTADGRFAIDAVSGVVTLVRAIDELALGTQSIEVEARSADGSSTRARFDITVVALNDQVPVIVSDGGADRVDLVVDEGAAFLTRVQAVDADRPAQTLTYRIAGGADAAAFVMDAASGELRFAVAPDAETIADPARRFEVLVEASDGLNVDQQWLTAAVRDIDEFDVGLPMDIDPAAEAVAEDAAVGTSVGLTIRAVDADSGTNAVSYSLDDDAAGRFAIDPQSGAVTVAGALDREAQATHGIVVRATSADGSSATRGYTIAVTPVNEDPPVIVAPADAVILVPEGTSTASDLLRVQATDGDLPAAPISYSLAGGADAGRFALDAASGALRFLAAPDHEAPVDADGDNRYEITVRASDGERWTDRSVVVVVGNVNETPQAGAVDLGRTNEDQAFEFGAAELLAASSDPDGDSLAITAVRVEQGSGTLADLGSGRWRFTPAADWSGAVVFGFTVSDAALSEGSTAALAVEPVDDAPVLSANSLAINQGAAALVLRATDVDTAPEALVYGVLGSTGGQFELAGAAGQSIDRFSQADVDAGRVVFVPDASGRTPSFALSLSDGSTVLALQEPAVTSTRFAGEAPAASLSAVEPTPVSLAPSEPAAAPQADPVAPDAPAAIRAAASPAPEPERVTVDEATPAATAPTNRLASAASVVRTSSSEVAVAGMDLRQLLAAEGAADMRGPALSYEWLDARTRAALAAALDRVQDEMQGELGLDSITVAGSTAIGTGLSVGYVLWLARGGVLVASLMSSVPAWASIDPLPVLSQMRRDEDGDDADSEIDPVERLFDRARRLVRRDATDGPRPEAAPARAVTPEEGA